MLIKRMFEPPEVSHERLFVISVLGFIVNLVGIFVFNHGGGDHGHSHGGDGGCHGHGHSHSSHGHSHDSNDKVRFKFCGYSIMTRLRSDLPGPNSNRWPGSPSLRSRSKSRTVKGSSDFDLFRAGGIATTIIVTTMTTKATITILIMMINKR